MTHIIEKVVPVIALATVLAAIAGQQQQGGGGGGGGGGQTATLSFVITDSSTGLPITYASTSVTAPGYSQSQVGSNPIFTNVPLGSISFSVSAPPKYNSFGPQTTNFTGAQNIPIALLPVQNLQVANVNITLKDSSTGALLNGSVNLGGIVANTVNGVAAFANVGETSTPYSASATVSGYASFGTAVNVPVGSPNPLNVIFNLIKSTVGGFTLQVSNLAVSKVIQGTAGKQLEAVFNVLNTTAAAVSFTIAGGVTNSLGQQLFAINSSAFTVGANATVSIDHVIQGIIPNGHPGNYTLKIYLLSLNGGVLSNQPSVTVAVGA